MSFKFYPREDFLKKVSREFSKKMLGDFQERFSGKIPADFKKRFLKI